LETQNDKEVFELDYFSSSEDDDEDLDEVIIFKIFKTSLNMNMSRISTIIKIIIMIGTLLTMLMYSTV
jgi:hypothetical protein